MTTSIRIGIVGVGKIARDQHLPALRASADFNLLAAASRNASVDGLANFHDLAALLESGPEIDAITLCTPPQGRHALAAAAIAAGKHVMLEKPPGATVGEVTDLARRARAKGVTLFASWHSRAAPAVEPARAWLEDRAIQSARITWKEDVRVWHPGQDWIFEPGGLGVFDPGINALSIVTRILPDGLVLEEAVLDFPANRGAPIAAEMRFRCGGAPVEAVFDFRQTGPQSWDIAVEADDDRLDLREGGARLEVGGVAASPVPSREYPNLYERFAALVRAGESDVDIAPLQLVADAFLIGRRREVEPFEF